VLEKLHHATRRLEIGLEVREDRHVYASIDDFMTWADGRNGWLTEAFYRHMRKHHGILLEPDVRPLGGQRKLHQSHEQLLP